MIKVTPTNTRYLVEEPKTHEHTEIYHQKSSWQIWIGVNVYIDVEAMAH